MDLQLRDKCVLITGAAGGIGRALAQTFADEGARLALHAFGHFDELEPWIRERGWQQCAVPVRADVRAPDKIEAAVQDAADVLGRLDVAVVNAGVWPPEDMPLTEMSVERIRDTIDTNLLGAIWTARAFLRCLAQRGPRSEGHGACLVFIGSTAGRFGEAGHVDYAVTKSALRGLVLTLKNEIVALDPYARVNMVEPGWTVTPMAEASLEQPGTIQKVLRTTPLQQVARARDISRVVAMLASPLCRHVTGEIVTVSGGMEGRVQWQAEQVDEHRVRARLT
ncbi:MAG: SDR family NAD(P)-dependent oxidoreductase [Myxococcota bacterium]